MQTWFIDDNGEWHFDKFIYNQDVISQNVRCILKLQKQELQWNIDKGVDYQVDLTPINKSNIDADIMKQVQDVIGVRAIKEYESVIDNKTKKFKVIKLTVITKFDSNPLSINLDK